MKTAIAGVLEIGESGPIWATKIGVARGFSTASVFEMDAAEQYSR